MKASQEVLKSFLPDLGVHEYKYGYERFRHLKESWKNNYAFGSRTFRPMSVGLGFDYKRKFDNGFGQGWSEPWATTEDRKQFMILRKEELKNVPQDKYNGDEEEGSGASGNNGSGSGSTV